MFCGFSFQIRFMAGTRLPQLPSHYTRRSQSSPKATATPQHSGKSNSKDGFLWLRHRNTTLEHEWVQITGDFAWLGFSGRKSRRKTCEFQGLSYSIRFNPQNIIVQSKSAKSSSSVLANTMLFHESSWNKTILWEVMWKNLVF